MEKIIKNKKVTIDDLAIMVAKGFEGVGKRFDKVEKDVEELKEGNKNIRKDILNLGDRFPSQFSFDELSKRVYKIEEKIK
jgi:hypothetical protein